MASGHVNRIKRPNTWLHRPMLQNVKKALANPEPSTHDPKRTSLHPVAGTCFLRRVRMRPTLASTTRQAQSIVLRSIRVPLSTRRRRPLLAF